MRFPSGPWQTSLYGSYLKTSYNATANANLCAVGGVTSAIIGAAGAASAGCDNSFAAWNIGTRTQWNVDSQTAMGIDIIYQRLQTGSAGVVTSLPAVGTQPAGARSISDQSSWMGQFRIHRNFYP